MKRWMPWLVWGCVGCINTAAGAQPQQPLIEPGTRLSTYLQNSAQQLSSNPDGLGLVWTTPEEKQRQQGVYQRLSQELKALRETGSLNETSFQALNQLLQGMPPTGRVKTPAANAQWLQSNPRRDPRLQPEDTVSWPQPRPKAVRVLNERGHICEVPHRVGLQARDYVAACPDILPGDWAWVTQPDGRVQQDGLGWWNPSNQDAVGPGAWVWAPSPQIKGRVPSAFHQAWAEWLGTQGVATSRPIEQYSNSTQQARPAVPLSSAWDVRGRYFDPLPSANNWGNVGLIQTPTARMRTEGHVGVSFHWFYPYQSFNVMFQPFSWMEMGFRYVDVENRLYSDNLAFSGTLPYKDKSLDLKLRAIREDALWPEVAVGWRDLAGTGLFSSEYVVASKRFGRFDVSTGLAWGNMGARGNISNPMSRLLGSRYDARVNNQGEGGNFSAGSWFRGNPALMGGIEYQSPWNLVFKAEWDGNNYQHQPQDNNLPQTSPINWGVVYRARPGFDVSAGFERGQRFTFGLTIYADMSGLNMPKVTDPALPSLGAARSSQTPDWQRTAANVSQHTLWQVPQMYRRDSTVVVQAERSYHTYAEDRLNKAVAVLHRDAPEDVTQFEVHHRNVGDVLAVETVNREEWVQKQLQPPRTQEPPKVTPVSYELSSKLAQPLLKQDLVQAKFEPGLDLLQTLGGPNGYLYQFSATGNMMLDLPWNVKSNGTLRMRINDNYDQFTTPGWSYMQPVRTNIREYLRTSRVTLDNFTVSKSERLGRNWYAAVYGGMFEPMFGGVGGEVLYRQPGSVWAVSADVNHVKQRVFEQNLQFQDYGVNTGHVTGHWITPFEGVHASLAVGQYLAKDRGATLSMTKTFQNGSTITGFASKTNVTAAVFGEGSFDKGILWTIPFDAMLTSSSRFNAGFGWRPLIRDGAAKVQRPVDLFAETTWISPRAKAYRRAPPSNDSVPPDDRVAPALRP